MMNSDQSYVLSETISLIGKSSVYLDDLNQLLAKQGYEIQILDPQNAVETLKSKLPDLIILGHLKDTALCKTLTSDDTLSILPILAFPVEDPFLKPSIIYQLGCRDYLSVPLQPEEAIARVENQMRVIRLEKQLRETSEKLRLSIETSREAEVTLGRLNKDLEKPISLDTITQVASHSRFQEYLDQQWRQECRKRIIWADSAQTSISLILCALDNLLDYKQQHGTESAEQYLKEVAQTIVRHIKRPSDLVARYKDDMFAVLLPNTNNQGAIQVAHIIYNAIKAIDSSLTVSVGVTTEIPTAALPSQLIVRNASQAYVKASESGGNCVVNHEEEF